MTTDLARLLDVAYDHGTLTDALKASDRATILDAADRNLIRITPHTGGGPVNARFAVTASCVHWGKYTVHLTDAGIQARGAA